tara:strand:+ start:128985 stop:129854 length:870 start_codon:yes stop_codon:yes gene_type:complete
MGGLFGGGRKKTTVEEEEKNLVLSRIIKFTYLQSLAIDGGITTAREIAGETEARDEEDVTQGGNLSTESAFVQNNPELVNALLGGPVPGGAGEQLNRELQSLFGKKTERSVKVDYKESGWTLTKVWNQPQFNVVRYAIGIKDLTIAQFTYEETSEIISKPWGSPKEIVKVILNVDQFIPGVFPPGNYIEYYIKPNTDNSEWVQINPLGFPSVFRDDGSIVPRVISFNTEQPLGARLEDSYVTTEEPVKEIIFRAVLKRPTTLDGTTASADGYSPILRSYRLLITPKNGL